MTANEEKALLQVLTDADAAVQAAPFALLGLSAPWDWPGDLLLPDILTLRLPHRAGSRYLHFEDPAHVRATELLPGHLLVPLFRPSMRLVVLRTFPASAVVQALGPNEPDLPAGTRLVIGQNARLVPNGDAP